MSFFPSRLPSRINPYDVAYVLESVQITAQDSGTCIIFTMAAEYCLPMRMSCSFVTPKYNPHLERKTSYRVLDHMGSISTGHFGRPKNDGCKSPHRSRRYEPNDELWSFPIFHSTKCKRFGRFSLPSQSAFGNVPSSLAMNLHFIVIGYIRGNCDFCK